MEGQKQDNFLKLEQFLLEIKTLKEENSKLKNLIINKDEEIKRKKREIFQLQTKNKRKAEYISHFSHEFKVPLCAIKGFASLLLEDDLSKEKQISFCKNILKATEHLFQIINYNIDIVRAETNKINLIYEEFSPSDVINEVFSVLEEKIKEKNIKLYLNMQKTLLIADKRLFRQLIYNLVGNAYKYNKINGKIVINTFCKDGKFYFKIKDTGCGIDIEKQKKVFEFFSNINTYVYDCSESSGIGLSLCKKIINLHGGEIDFVSKNNKGCLFWFYLPLKKVM